MSESEHSSKSNTFKLTVKLEFDTEEEASMIGEALKVDDDEFIKTTVEGRIVTGSVEASTLESARRAADDWMACLLSVHKKLDQEKE